MRIAWGMLAAALSIASPAGAQEFGDAAAGAAYAKRACSDCHAVLRGDQDSPIIDAPSFTNVANTPGMTARALLVWLQSSHPSMPNLILAPDDRDNVIAYILSLKEVRK